MCVDSYCVLCSFPWSGGAAPSVSARHALIMDEVDGMAGNEDRGGIQVTQALWLLFYCGL